MMRVKAFLCVVGYLLEWPPRMAMLALPKTNGCSDALRGQFPWQLILKRNGVFTCGAVLISPTRALTAAHCLRNTTHSDFFIEGGGHKISEVSGNEITRAIKSWTAHPSYSSAGPDNDIAVLRWDEAFPNNSYIQPIPRVSISAANVSGATCTVSGWGMTVSGYNHLSDVLQHVNMTVISNADCTESYASISSAAIDYFHLCIVGKPEKSSCVRDSGGPVVCDGLLAGITSWRNMADYPSVNTRVSYFESWINENL